MTNGKGVPMAKGNVVVLDYESRFVEVEGVGRIEVPEDASDEEVAAIVQRAKEPPRSELERLLRDHPKIGADLSSTTDVVTAFQFPCVPTSKI